MATPRPPGPRSWHPLGSMPVFRRDPIAFLENAAAEHGDVVEFRFGPRYAYLVNHPDLIREVLVLRHRDFIKSRLLQRARELLGTGLLTSEGEFHLRQRRMIQPSFHRDRIALYASEMVKLAGEMADRWQEGEIVDISREMNRLTLAIAGRTLLGSEVELGDADRIGDALTDALGIFERVTNPLAPLLDRLPVPSTRRLQAARNDLDRTILDMIEQRRKTAERGTDLLSTLIMAQDEEGDGVRMTNAELRDEILTIFLAGHETTANALSWTWYLLSEHPEIGARLRDELHDVLGDRLPTVDDFGKLPYTRKVLTESMRLYPPAWSLGREPVRDLEIGGYGIRAGSVLLVSPWITQRDARFFAQPDVFDPDRWTEEMEMALPKFAYFPFGGGSRKCIGEGFAWMEGVLVLATLARRWEPRLIAGQHVRPLPLITLRLADGAHMQLMRTSPPPSVQATA